MYGLEKLIIEIILKTRESERTVAERFP